MELFLGGVVVFILVAIVVMYLMGKNMPVTHTSTLSHKFFAPPDKLWRMITDLPTYTNWRGVKVEPLGPKKWKETISNQELVLEEVERVENKRFVLSLHSEKPSIVYGRRWTIDLVPSTDYNSTVVTITETGEVHKPFMRFVSKYLYGHNTTKRIYLVKLEKALQAGK